MKGFYLVSDWIMKLCLINFLWIFFSCLGGLVLGVFPSTAAMLKIIHLLILKEDPPIIKTFWKNFKNYFWRSNFTGLILILISYFFYLDLSLIKNMTGWIQFFYSPILIMAIIYGLSTIYVFPLLVIYKIQAINLLKNSFLLLVIYPIYTFLMLLISFIYIFVLTRIPSLIPFLSFSTIALIIMTFTHLILQKNEKKLSETKENSLSITRDDPILDR